MDGGIISFPLCLQLVQVATPTGLGQQSIVFVLITNEALYILRKGKPPIITTYGNVFFVAGSFMSHSSLNFVLHCDPIG